MDLPDDDPDMRYNAVARFLHWVIAFLIMGMLALGLTMESVNYGIPRHEVYDLHKSIGLIILALAIARLFWRFFSIAPEVLDTHASWEKVLAKAAHIFLYVAMIGMPLSGWLMSDAGGRPPTFFGLDIIPRLVESNDAQRDLFGALHYWLAMGLIGVIGLHVAGALKHHIIDKDATLRRMAGNRLQWFKAIFVILIMDIGLSAAAFLFLKDTVLEKVVSPAGVARTAPAALPDLSALTAHEWQIDPRHSALAFEVMVMGAPFSVNINKFGGSIILDPDNMRMARADITIDMNDLASGDISRDDTMRSSEWFAAGQWPQARYVTQTIEKMDGHNYIAIGNLTIRDVTMPLAIPFTLKFIESGEVRKALMEGRVVLRRLDFGVGQGEWQSTEAVGDDVMVTIMLTALQPRR